MPYISTISCTTYISYTTCMHTAPVVGRSRLTTWAHTQPWLARIGLPSVSPAPIPPWFGALPRDMLTAPTTRLGPLSPAAACLTRSHTRSHYSHAPVLPRSRILTLSHSHAPALSQYRFLGRKEGMWRMCGGGVLTWASYGSNPVLHRWFVSRDFDVGQWIAAKHGTSMV